jgi:CBS domain-containing protein
MEVEVREIAEHIGHFAPFDRLSVELLETVASSVEIAYFQAGSSIFEFGEPIHSLYYIRSGAVEVYRHNAELYNRLGEGDIFGQTGLLRTQRVRFPAKAIEDTLLYLIPETIFDRLCAEDENFADFVELSGSRLKATVEQSERENDMMITRVRSLLSRLPVSIEESATVQEAARLMTESHVSSVLLLAPAEESDEEAFRQFDEPTTWRMTGILTDHDFRVRVLAEGGSAQTRLADIKHDQLVTIQSDETIYEAMLAMLRNNVHHLPVLHRRRPVGVVHLSDIVRYETKSSLYLVSNIFSQPNVEGLARLMPDLRAAFVHLSDEGASSRMIGSAVTTVGRSLVRRLLELAEAELGAAPVPYCFMVNGSMARDEQTVTTDQDHALILDDRFDPEQHDAYFLELAKRVSDGMNACGYPYCSGGIMATNAQWRQPLSVWKRYFEEWIAEPDPQRLLHSSIFFDLDAVYGEEHFVETLQDLIASRAGKNPPFLAALARNALSRTPPLGFFRTFVMEKDGKQRNSINLKRRGTAPMVDVIRIHALAIASTAQNSFERLDDIEQAGTLPAGQADKLRYALEVIAMVRIRHQAYDLRLERPPDNNIEPENVSDVERHNLKDAFQVLSNAQKFLRFRYPTPNR